MIRLDHYLIIGINFEIERIIKYLLKYENILDFYMVGLIKRFK